MTRIAVIGGDGIGPEVMETAVQVLACVAACGGRALEAVRFNYGADRYLSDGVALPPDALDLFRSEFDAILLGALGDPRVPDSRHAREILFGIRFGLDLYANVRPVQLLHSRLTPLKNVGEGDLDFTVFRENTEDLYVGIGGVFKAGTPDEIAIEESISSRKGVERILQAAFAFAAESGLGKVTMSDKSNALRYSGQLWQGCFEQLKRRYPGLATEHLYIDALAMKMIREPGSFDVIVTSNLFGDIITDLAAQLQGGLGVAASGNINPAGICMFEPVHGSAPDLVGKSIANPIGAILSTKMMLQHLGWSDEAEAIGKAVKETVSAGECTPDLDGNLTTELVGQAIIRRIRNGTGR